MKKLITLIVLALPLCARAQLLGEFSTMNRTNMWITNSITASATYTYVGTNMVDVSRYQNVGWEFSFLGSADATNDITITFKRSPDGTNYETSPLYSWVISSQGTNAVLALTNFPAAPAFMWKPYQITSAATNSLTNAFLYGLKRSATGGD